MRRKAAKAWVDTKLAMWCARLETALSDLETLDGRAGMHETLNRAHVEVTRTDSDPEDRFLTVRDPLAAPGERQMTARVYFAPSREEVFVIDNTVDTDRDWLNMTTVDGPWWDMLDEYDVVTILDAAVAAEADERAAQEAERENKRLARIARLAARYSDADENPGGGGGNGGGQPTP